MSRKLYNVTARVVDLIWADSPESAVAALTRELEAKGFEVTYDTSGGNVDVSVGAFVSEPVPDMGWEGE